MFNKLRVEIQIRSKLQHAWATANEVVAIFSSGGAIKYNLNDEEWKRFFKLMASWIAIQERQPLVADTPTDPAELKAQLKAVATQLKVATVLSGFVISTTFIDPVEGAEAAAFLLVMDPVRKTLEVLPFKKQRLAEANAEYLRKEKETEGTGCNVVLVSVDGINQLKKAYTNYYSDTKLFSETLMRAIE